jgi:Tfp pilus assembly protein PilW
MRVDTGEVLITNETYFNRDPNYRVDWRGADGVGSNCLACYESSSEPATYYPFEQQHGEKGTNPATDCYYVAGLRTPDWDFIVRT